MTEALIPQDMQDHPVSQILADCWDGGDLWGSAMSEAFALCDFAWFYLDARGEIPADMGFRPSVFGADTEEIRYADLVAAYQSGDITRADVISYLPILSRFIDACKAAGLSY